MKLVREINQWRESASESESVVRVLSMVYLVAQIVFLAIGKSKGKFPVEAYPVFALVIGSSLLYTFWLYYLPKSNFKMDMLEISCLDVFSHVAMFFCYVMSDIFSIDYFYTAGTIVVWRYIQFSLFLLFLMRVITPKYITKQGRTTCLDWDIFGLNRLFYPKLWDVEKTSLSSKVTYSTIAVCLLFSFVWRYFGGSFDSYLVTAFFIVFFPFIGYALIRQEDIKYKLKIGEIAAEFGGVTISYSKIEDSVRPSIGLYIDEVAQQFPADPEKD